MKRFIPVAITAFWLVMMGSLARTVIGDPFAPQPVATTTNVPAPVTPSGFVDHWMGVYFGDLKIGYSNTTVADHRHRGVPGFTVRHTSDLVVPILGETRQLHLESLTYLDDARHPRSVMATIDSEGQQFTMQGQWHDDALVIDVEGGVLGSQQLRLDPDVHFVDVVTSPLLLKHLQPGEVRVLPVFDPATMSMGEAWLRVTGIEAWEWQDEQFTVSVIELRMHGIGTTLWVGPDGTTYREEHPSGFRLERETRDQALSVDLQQVRQAGDLLRELSIATDFPLPRPRDVSRMKVKFFGVKDLSGLSLEDPPRQLRGTGRGVVLDISVPPPPAEALPLDTLPSTGWEPYLQSTPLIQADAPELVDQARALVASAPTSWDAAQRLGTWVFESIAKTPVVGMPSALDVWRTRKGDCNEHTALFTALARSVGIPTQVCAGVVYYRDGFYYHAWPKVWVGEWVAMDPTLGQPLADASHIQFVSGDFGQQAVLVRLIGQLELRVLEYAHD